jgi:hypothetical protein
MYPICQGEYQLMSSYKYGEVIYPPAIEKHRRMSQPEGLESVGPVPLGLEQAVLHGVLHQGRRIASAGFLQQALAMGLHRPLAGKELFRDL